MRIKAFRLNRLWIHKQIFRSKAFCLLKEGEKCFAYDTMDVDLKGKSSNPSLSQIALRKCR